MTAGTDTPIAIERDGKTDDQNSAVASALGRFWRRTTFGGFSSLSRRIVFLNLLALVALVAAILFLNQSRSSLIDAEVRSLTAQGELIANSIAAQATNVPGTAVLRTPQEALDLEAAADYVAGLEFPIDPTRAGTLITYLSASAGPFASTTQPATGLWIQTLPRSHAPIFLRSDKASRRYWNGFGAPPRAGFGAMIYQSTPNMIVPKASIMKKLPPR